MEVVRAQHVETAPRASSIHTQQLLVQLQTGVQERH